MLYKNDTEIQRAEVAIGQQLKEVIMPLGRRYYLPKVQDCLVNIDKNSLSLPGDLERMYTFLPSANYTANRMHDHGLTVTSLNGSGMTLDSAIPNLSIPANVTHVGFYLEGSPTTLTCEMDFQIPDASANWKGLVNFSYGTQVRLEVTDTGYAFYSDTSEIVTPLVSNIPLRHHFLMTLELRSDGKVYCFGKSETGSTFSSVLNNPTFHADATRFNAKGSTAQGGAGTLKLFKFRIWRGLLSQEEIDTLLQYD